MPVCGLIQGIEPAATDPISRLHIVFELKLRAGRPDGTALVGDVVHDAAVACLRDVVVELQLEPVELVARDEVAGIMGIGTDKRAVLDLPPGANTLAFEVVPPGEVLAIKQELPAGGLLRVGEPVEVRGVGLSLRVRDLQESRRR